MSNHHVSPDLGSLATLRDFERHRLSSYDRAGGNTDCIIIEPGAIAELGRVSGPGKVTHTWCTMMALPFRQADETWLMRDVVLRYYWDGEDTPSVDAPIGDFHGVGFGIRKNTSSGPVQMSPQDGKSLNCWFPMPFADGARFEVVNESPNQIIFYYYIDYESYTAPLPDDVGRFHAHYRQQVSTGRDGVEWTRADYAYSDDRPAGPGLGIGGPWADPNLSTTDNYVIADISGNGQFVGCVMNINVLNRQINDWYGEGDDMFVIDGEPWPPRLHGTGTEDYFNTAFCPTQEFCEPYHGITVYSGTPEWPWGGRNSMYRFHVLDPIRFRTSLHASIETGHANALNNRYSSVAYWYQTGRAAPLPKLPNAQDRHEP